MEQRKRGLTMIQVRDETRTLVKKLAKAAGQTIPDWLAGAVERIALEHGEPVPEKYRTEEEVDRKILAGDFEETGRGKPQDKYEEFEWKGKKYRFRRLWMTPQDRKTWDAYCKDDDGPWEAYAEWFFRKVGRHWRGKDEWEDPYIRG